MYNILYICKLFTIYIYCIYWYVSFKQFIVHFHAVNLYCYGILLYIYFCNFSFTHNMFLSFTEIDLSKPGMSFLGSRVYTSSILLGTSAVLSKLIVTICAVLTHILPNTGCYQASAFSPYDEAEVASPACFLRVHMGMNPTMQFYTSPLGACHFAGNVFLFLHLAPSIFLHDSNQKFLWSPWWRPLPQMHFAAFSCSFPSTN